MYIFQSHARSKHIRITIRANGTVLVTKPRYVSKEIAEQFVLSREAWIKKELEKQKQRARTDIGRSDREHFEMHRESARELIHRKLAEWNEKYGFTIGQIRIKSMTSCWGSCSSKGNLSFNYKLLFLPERMIDYVIVHELCHLKEFNHSKKFWELVEQTIPDHKKIKKELLNVK